jgi:uncharacterized protein (TIGR03067 family)
MYRALLAILVVWPLLCAQDAGDAAKRDKEKLQGNWKATEGISGGKKAEVEVRMTFQGDKVWMVAGGGGGSFRGTYSIDPRKSPATVDFIPSPELNEKTVLAIYELKGDELKICHTLLHKGGERPKSFEATAKTVLLTLKRQKPGDGK